MYWYQNALYGVLPNPTKTGYHIVNLETKVVEGTTEVLPAAVSKADVWCDLLTEIINRKS